MTTIAYLAVSLDGFIADSNGGVDWLNEIPNPTNSDYGFAEFMAGIDAMVMGSKTFQVVQSFGMWPYKKPVFVASKAMTHAPAGYEERISLVCGPIDEILEELGAQGYDRIYLDGGSIVRSSLQAGLLDELILTHIPIVLGTGISLFSDSVPRTDLQHVATEVLGIGLVKSHYRVRRDASR